MSINNILFIDYFLLLLIKHFLLTAAMVRRSKKKARSLSRNGRGQFSSTATENDNVLTEANYELQSDIFTVQSAAEILLVDSSDNRSTESRNPPELELVTIDQQSEAEFIDCFDISSQFDVACSPETKHPDGELSDEEKITDSVDELFEKFGDTMNVLKRVDTDALSERKRFLVDPNVLVNTCEKCYRESTDSYPLDIQPTSIHNVNNSLYFGANLVENSSAKICSLCRRYLSCRQWKYAWAAVLCTLLFFGSQLGCNGEYFFSLLPCTFSSSWQSAAVSAGFSDKSLPLFNDFTAIQHDFTVLIEQKKAKALKYGLNFFTFPFVKCPYGCSAQISAVGQITFKHMLNFLFPLFTAFKANRRRLRGMRQDFLAATLHLKFFMSSPCLAVDDNGLNLVTCSMHNNALNKSFIHIPKSPLGNLIHPHADRLALIATKLLSVTPSKVRAFSNSYTMATSVGGAEGISAVQLTSSRLLNIKSPQLLPQIESLFVKYRVDSKNFLRTLQNNQEVDEAFVLSLLDCSDLPSFDDVKRHINSSTHMTLFSMLSLHTFLNRTSSLKASIPPSLTISHHPDSFGAEPFFPPVSFLRKNVSFFVLCQWFTNFEFFGHMLLNISNTHQFLFSYLSTLVKGYPAPLKRGVDLTCKTFNLAPHSSDQNCNFNLLAQVVENMPFCEFVYCPTRSHILLVDTQSAITSSNVDVHAIVIVCNEGWSRPYPIPESIFLFGNKFFLVNVGGQDLKEFFIRYGDCFDHWWHFTVRTHVCRKTTPGFEFPLDLKRSWRFLLYLDNYREMIDQTSCLQFFSTQDFVHCSEHSLPLSTDINDTLFKCSVTDCSRKSRWRCPNVDCSACCCLKHFKGFIRKNQVVFLAPSNTIDYQSDSAESASSFRNSKGFVDDSDYDDFFSRV